MRLQSLIIIALAAAFALAPLAAPARAVDVPAPPPVAAAAPGAGDSHAARARGGRDLTARQARHVFELLFRARARTALGLLDSLRATCDEGPLYHIMRARAYREFLPVDDAAKDRVHAMAEPIYDELRRTIELTTARIEAGDTDPKLYLYRGWAWMFRSHVHTYERAMWTAGREAKRGKKDLEHYLRLRPNDPVAGSIMGAFLYFADTLPAAYKFVSKLLFLPGGDRARGLEMMELAVGWDSLVEEDNRLILYSVDIGFEGRFETGMEGFEALLRRHPDHATFLRPAVILLPLRPRYRESLGDALDVQIDAMGAVPRGETEEASYWLMRYMQGLSERIYHPRRAVRRLETVVHARPDAPDWVTAFARFELGRIDAATGRPDAARRWFTAAAAHPFAGEVRGEAKVMTEALDDDYPGATTPDPDLVRGIYRDAESAARALDTLRTRSRPTATEAFYAGEAAMALGRDDEALEAYRRAVDTGAPPWDDFVRMLAASRAGELLAVAGRYDEAARAYETARRFWHHEYLYDWLLEGRARYFHRLAEGRDDPPARWFAAR